MGGTPVFAQNFDSCSVKLKNGENLNQILNSWMNKGYLLARIEKKGKSQAMVYPGKRFELITSGLGDSVYNENPAQRQIRIENRLSMLEDEGFPFAAITFKLDSFSGNRIYIREEMVPGVYCLWDTVVIKGMSVSSRFLRQTSGIVKGEPFSMSRFRQLQTSLSAIEGLGKWGSDDLHFVDGALRVNPGYGRNRPDRLNAMLGLATGEGKAPVLSGEFDAAFYGLFGNASSILARWQSFKARSQELKLTAELPYLGGLPFISGISIGFEKFDTLYTRFRRGLMLKFPTGENWRWKLGFDYTGVTRIWADENTVQRRKMLPQNHNSKMWLYFGELEFGSVSRNTAPRNGIQGWLKFGAGTRTVIPDPKFAQYQWKNSEGFFENIYDSLKRTGGLRSAQYRLQYQCWFYRPLGRFLVLANRVMGEEIALPRMFFSELSRWGGLNSLRGFNEQSIFANSFHLAMTELRFMTGTSGFIAPFFSVARYVNKTAVGGPAFGMPYSTGIAASVKTAVGILQICWALGSDQGVPPKLNNSKFHMGIGSTF